MKKERNELLKANGETFSVKFKSAIHKGDETEIFGFIGAIFFGKENNEGFIYRPKVRSEGVKILKRFKEVIPGRFRFFLNKQGQNRQLEWIEGGEGNKGERG
jgi:hypothetical protein